MTPEREARIERQNRSAGTSLERIEPESTTRRESGFVPYETW